MLEYQLQLGHYCESEESTLPSVGRVSIHKILLSVVCYHSLPQCHRTALLQITTPSQAATMAMSGVKLTEGCLVTYQDIQKSKKHRYAVFVIREGQIDVETVSSQLMNFVHMT